MFCSVGIQPLVSISAKLLSDYNPDRPDRRPWIM